MPVASFTIATLAPAMLRFDGSRTVPRMAPVELSCAKQENENATNAKLDKMQRDMDSLRRK